MTPFMKNRRNIRILGALRLSVTSVLAIILAGLLAYFVENIASSLLPDHTSAWDYLWAAAIVGGLIYLMFWFAHDRIARQVTATAQICDAGEIKDRPYLICGISPASSRKDNDGNLMGPMIMDLASFTRDLETACADKESPLTNWQQNLRVLKAMSEVRHLYVLRPDVDQFDRFEKILRHFFDDERLSIKLVTDNQGSTTFKRNFKEDVEPDYEDFRYVTMGIDRGLEMIAKDHKISIEEAEAGTVIDVTAGLKTFSIAAAITSLNRNLLFVYAGTHENTGRVLGYDVSIRLLGEKPL